MRIVIAFLICSLLLQAEAQELPSDQRIQKANEIVAFLAATSDPIKQDSLNKILKQELKAILGSDEVAALSLDELKLSRIDAPDGSFRLITWNLPQQSGGHLYEGLLLHVNGKKRALYELRDMTSSIASPEVPELSPDQWYGALYYEVVPVKRGGKTYYTLLGWKGHDRVETQKVIEVLHFKGGTPRFGAPVFGSGRLKRTRQVFRYSFQSSMTLRYDPAGTRIVLDHLSPSRADLEGQFAFYGPDMSMDAYVWEKDHWEFQRDIDARDRSRSDKPFNAPPPQPKP